VGIVVHCMPDHAGLIGSVPTGTETAGRANSVILFIAMEPNEASSLRRKRANLTSLLEQFQKQDDLLQGLIPHSQSWEGAPDSMMKVLQDLFGQATELLPEKRITFDDNNGIDALRSQIISVRAKIGSGISSINETLDHNRPPDVAPTQVAQVPSSVDRRRIFVVHGRNMMARDALFTFLRAINLDPIEWEEAIAMTGEGTPFTGHTLEEAFSRSQAAVVLLSGDDLARLGKNFLNHADLAEERTLTPQARPNVLFEAGIAFGSYPERTVIVSLGKTRAFSDIAGRHIIYISNSVASRQKLADRLTTAGCDVKTQGKQDWHTAGDFDSAMTTPDGPIGKDQFGLKISRREAQDDQKANVKHKIWIEIRNDSETCHEVRYANWKQTLNGIRSTSRSKTFQIKLEGNWCPEQKGVERLKLPPGECCQTWIRPDDPHTMDDIERRCQSEGQIGTLVLLVDGVEIGFSI
jgi:predicted nucleotide-binding protein